MIRIVRLRFAGLGPSDCDWSADAPDAFPTDAGPLAIGVADGDEGATFLDALCRALFARGLRADAPDREQSTNTMPADCFAEVTFTAGKKRYCCCWRRTRQGADADHRLLELPGAAPVAVGSEAIGRALAEIGVGDFDRFTTSVVLRAQSVAHIPRASPAEWVAILERHRGAAAYAHAVASIHERAEQLREALGTLQTDMASVPLLEEPREERLRNRLASFRARAEKAGTRERDLREALVRLALIARAEHACASTEAELAELSRRREELRTDFERLHRAREAETLSSTAPPLEQLHARCEQKAATVRELEQQRAQAESLLGEARDQHDTAQAELGAAREARAQESPAIGRARELDTSIALLTKRVAALDRRSAELNKERADLLNRIARTERARDQEVVGRKREEQYLTTHERDARLGTELTGIARTFESLTRSHAARQATQRELTGASRKREEAAAVYAQREREHERATRALEQARQNRAKIADSLERLLAGRSLVQWRDDLADSMQLRELLSRIDDSLGERTAERQRQEQLERSLRDRRETHDRLQSEERTLLGRMQRIEEAGAHGVREPSANRATDSAQTVRDLRSMYERLCELRGERTAVEAEIAHTDSGLRDTRNHLAAIEQSIQAGLRRSQLPTDLRTAPYRVRTRAEAVEREIRLARETIAQAEQLGKQEHDAAERVGVMHEAERTAHTELLLARHELDAAEKERSRMAQRDEQAAQTEARLVKEAAEMVKPYAVRTVAVGSLDTVLKQLARRRDDWRRHDEKHDEHAERQKKLDAELANRRVLLERIDDETARIARDAETAREELNRQERLRRQTLGDRDPEKEQARLESAAVSAERACAAAQQKVERMARELLELDQRLRTATDSFENAQREADEAQADYLARIRQQGFAEITDIEAARMPAEELAELARQEAAVGDEQTALEEKLHSMRAACAMFRENGPDQDLMQLELALAANGARLTRSREAMGAAKHRLGTNERARVRRRRLAAELKTTRQQRACCEELEHIMGGPDGLRYRAAAQLEALPVVLNAANRYLTHVCDRYRFVTDTGILSPLAVVDTWDLERKRPAGRLDGAELLLCGLALRLGLTEVTRSTPPIVPLFLDDYTTGLDASQAESLMHSLARLHQAGIPIAAITSNETLAQHTGEKAAHQTRSPGHDVATGAMRTAQGATPRPSAPAPGTGAVVQPDSDADVLAVVDRDVDPLAPPER